MIVKKIIDDNIRDIQPKTIIIYKNRNNYYITSKDVFVLYGLSRFKFYKVKNIFEMEISKRYINYILKQLTNANISYLIVDKINQYHLIKKEIFANNKYQFYYIKGRRLYKRHKQINKLITEISKSVTNQEIKRNILFVRRRMP